jgi:hypothetical protein
MRTLSQYELVDVQGAGATAYHRPCIGDFLAAIGQTWVGVDVVAKPQGSTRVEVKNNFVDVLVNVVWGRK